MPLNLTVVFIFYLFFYFFIVGAILLVHVELVQAAVYYSCSSAAHKLYFFTLTVFYTVLTSKCLKKNVNKKFILLLFSSKIRTIDVIYSLCVASKATNFLLLLLLKHYLSIKSLKNTFNLKLTFFDCFSSFFSAYEGLPLFWKHKKR